MTTDTVKYKMYVLVNRSLSGIQKGIQAAHAIVEYSLLYGDRPDYIKWASTDKTIVVLNGGSSNSGVDENGNYVGTLEQHISKMIGMGWVVAGFNEPNLNNALVAVAVVLPEMVWDRDAYPTPFDVMMGADYEVSVEATPEMTRMFEMREFISKFKSA